MAAFSSSPAPAAFSFGSSPLQRSKLYRKRRSALLVSACDKDANDHDFSGRLVDENMAVLRERIHEMKVGGAKYEAPSEWMEWEKQYHKRYRLDVCELMGMVQRWLLSSRPCVGLACVAVVALSLPMTVLVILFYRVKSVVAGSGAGGAGGGS
ncbi:hypothetical protein BHE74_00058848 [Ensete ventricosum]|nr:hypothetical protein BHE74_00058848 [Ensete ventricosum]